MECDLAQPPSASEGTPHQSAGGEMRADNFCFAFETDRHARLP